MILALSLIFLSAPDAKAQQFLVVQNCGTVPLALSVGSAGSITMDVSGKLCTNAGSGTVSGTTSNASSGVATSTTNIATVAWNYGFNGTTWDQLKTKAASVAAVATDTSLVTQLNPLSPGIIALGQAVKASSVPVTIASDQYVDPCQSPNIAKSSVPINITTATTTSLVAVSGTTVTYVCGVSMTVSEVITTPNTILFEYGTGATCTSPVALTGKYGDGGVTAGIPIVINASSGGTIFKSAASNGICALTAIGATASFQGVMTYVQQ